MNIGIRVLRFFFPQRERERQELRELTAINAATAEDLVRTFNKLNGEVIKKMLNAHDHRRGDH